MVGWRIIDVTCLAIFPVAVVKSDIIPGCWSMAISAAATKMD
jgi:hypothetical protein